MKKIVTFYKSFSLASILFVFTLALTSSSSMYAQFTFFDFKTTPVQTSLPINLTAGGITAYLTATGSGYSIQQANVLGFTPVGFNGFCIYPNSVYASDLQISFDQTLSDFSIMYSPQELGCDDSSTMRVTAYMNTTLVGTNTATVPNPGTWPTGTLSCSFSSGFNNVVVHYASHPPTCQDYGVIFMADNMQVSQSNLSDSNYSRAFMNGTISPNPVLASSTFSFSLSLQQHIKIEIYDLKGEIVKTIYEGVLESGTHFISLDDTKLLNGGVYILKVDGKSFSQSFKLIKLYK